RGHAYLWTRGARTSRQSVRKDRVARSGGDLMIRPGIRKDDMVQVIAGRDVSKTGKVLRVDQKSGRIYVEKLNLVKKHMRPTQKNPQGGVTEKEAGLHRSNVLLYCAKCKKGVRHRIKVATKAGDKKSRVCAKCNSSVGVN